MGRTSTVQSSRKARSSKGKKRKDEQPLYIALKARLLSAVYRVSYVDEDYRGPVRRASHQAIKRHLLQRQKEHLERYPVLGDTALTRAKQELVEAGILVKPNRASFALGKDARIKYKREHDDDKGVSGDELIGSTYVMMYKKHFRELPETDAESHSSDELESDAEPPREVKVGKKTRSKKGKGTAAVPVKSGSSSKSKKPATKKRKTRAVSAAATTSEDEASSEDVPLAKGKRTTKTKPKQEPKSETVRLKSALTRLLKVELVDKVLALQKTNAELQKKFEKQREEIEQLERVETSLQQDKERLEQDKSILERNNSTLSAGFLQLQSTEKALKARLAAYQRVEASEEEDETSPDQDAKVVQTDECETTGFGAAELEQEEQEDFGGYDGGMFDQHDDSGYADVDDVLTATRAAKDSSPALNSQRSTPALADSDAELPVDRPSPQHLLKTDVEQDQELGFDHSYPELRLDSPAQPQRHSPAPSQARRSWASLGHPPSPATSSEGHGELAQQRLLDLEGGPSGEKQNAFPTPDLSSSPVKRGFQRDDDEGSAIAPTVIAEEVDEEMLSNDGMLEEESKIQRLEREIIDLRTSLGEVEKAKELMKQELDIVARRYQDQIESTNTELSNANESRLAVENKVATFEPDLSVMHQTVDNETRRVAELQAELAVAEAELASANAARDKGEATVQATKEELDIVSHRFQDGMAESTEQLTQLELEYTTAQDRVRDISEELVAGTQQLQAAQARIHDLENSLEQTKSTHTALVKADLERQDRLLAANHTVDELTAKVRSLESVYQLVTNEKAALVDRLSRVQIEKSQVDSKLSQATKELADEQRGAGLLRAEIDTISRRYRDQIDALSADLDTTASESVELESQVSSLEQSLSEVKAQVTEERTRANQLQITLTNANSSHDETVKQQETAISHLQTTIDELNHDLVFARSAHETLAVEKAAVESQLSLLRQQAQQTSVALEKKARSSEMLTNELDLVSQAYRDATETSSSRVHELESELMEAREKIVELEDELSRAESSAEEARCRIDELEEKLTSADEPYAELAKLNEKHEATVAESTSKLEDAIANIAILISFQDTLETSKASLEDELSTVQQGLDLSRKEEAKQAARLESLQVELETMAKAYQEQAKEAAENLSIAEEHLFIAEIDAATLKEELDVTDSALTEEQSRSETLGHQLEGATESCNALAEEKGRFLSALTSADAKVDQLSTRTDGLVADLDTCRAEKATLEGHSLMLEQDLSTARGQISTVNRSLEEEQSRAASLKAALDAEKETHHRDLEQLEKLQVGYNVVYQAESQLRSHLRSFVNSRGLSSSTGFSDSTTGAPLSYIDSLQTHLLDLDRQLGEAAGQLDSAQALANQVLASFPDHLISPLQADTHRDGEVTSLDESLRQTLNRVSLLVETAESASAELEEVIATSAKPPTVDVATSTDYQLEKVLETLDSKLRELDAVLALSAEGVTSIDIDEAPLSGHDNLQLLVEQIKTRVQSFGHVDEQRKSESRRLKEELMEEVAKRSRAVAKLREKTEETIKLEEQVQALKEKQGKALSLIQQGSMHLEA